MILGTKIKWFSHLNKNAPLLANEWGSLINVLDACLVNGFSEQQSTQITIIGNRLKLTYAQAHQYQQYQVITVSGAQTSSLNGPKRISEVSLDGLSLFIDFEDLTGVIENSLILTTKLTPLGWEKVYATTNKAVYKFVKDTGIPNYFFVDDSFPGSPYTTTWAKFARVGVSENYIADYTPLGATIPSDWSTYTTSVSGSETFLGTCKWFYATNADSTNATQTIKTSPVTGNRQWILTGDPTYFYIANATIPNSSLYTLYGVGEYDCIFQGFKDNTFLTSMYYAGQLSNQTIGGLPSYANSLVSFVINKPLFILKSYITDNSVAGFVSSYKDIDHSGYTNILSTSGPVNHFRALLKADNILHGSVKNLYWLALSQPYRHFQKIKQGTDVYLSITQYLNSNFLGQYVLKIGSKD